LPGHIHQFIALRSDTRTQDGQELDILFTDIEGGVYDIGSDENGVSRTKFPLLAIEPLVHFSFDHINGFLLAGCL
jgi:hypothetical protein